MLRSYGYGSGIGICLSIYEYMRYRDCALPETPMYTPLLASDTKYDAYCVHQLSTYFPYVYIYFILGYYDVKLVYRSIYPLIVWTTI